MGASNHEKMLKQLINKPVKMQKYLKHNKPKKRTTGKALRRCEQTDQFGGHIKMYGLNLCRQSFREIAEELGFKKYS
jgi:small subunit ribosomal protein S14